jgi:hypothetical protein
MIFIAYDDKGKILYHRTMAVEDIELYPDEQLTESDGVYESDHYYISGKVVKPRPTMPLTVTGSVISGIPQGATVTLGEQSFTVDDGEADIEGYTGVVKITCWPYLDAEVTL